jgi:hypothetical protein
MVLRVCSLRSLCIVNLQREEGGNSPSPLVGEGLGRGGGGEAFFTLSPALSH